MGNRGVQEVDKLTRNTSRSSRRSGRVGIADELGDELRPEMKGISLQVLITDERIQFLRLG
jgi:hypothetical protein